MQQAMCGSLPNTYIPDSVPSPSSDSHQFRLGCGSQPCLALSILVIIVSVATRPTETFAQSANGLISRTVLGAQQASVAGAKHTWPVNSKPVRQREQTKTAISYYVAGDRQ